MKFPNDKDFLHDARKCYIEVTCYLQKKLPFISPLLRDLQFIVPESTNDPKSKEAIGRIAEQLTKVTKDDKFCDAVKSEYSVLMYEDLTKEKKNI